MRRLFSIAAILAVLGIACFSTLRARGDPAPQPILVTTRVDELDGRAPWSLREAVLAAGQAGGQQVILLPAGTYTLSRVGAIENEALVGDLDVRNGSLTIYGAGADLTRVKWESLQPTHRLIEIHPNAGLSLVGLTLSGGGGTWQDHEGAAIRNLGTLSLRRCRLEENGAPSTGSAVTNRGRLAMEGCEFLRNTVRALHNASTAPALLRDCRFALNSGGSPSAIYNDLNADLEIDSCTFSHNLGDNGGAVYNRHGALRITNSTFYQNLSRYGKGGALFTSGFIPVLVDHCSFTGNQAREGGALYVEAQSELRLRNSIVAGNRTYSEQDVFGQVISLGNNVVGAARGATGFTGSDRIGDGAGLAPLDSYGGPTPTCALLPGSPALDFASNSSAPSFDQRGAPRPETPGGAPDSGAFEAGNDPILAAPLAAAMYRTTGPPVAIAPAATLFAPDTAALSGAILTITLVGAATSCDRLIPVDAGPVTVNDEEVRYAGALVATTNGVGTAGSPLAIAFVGPALSAAAVEAVARSVAFSTSSEGSIVEREIEMQLFDPSGRGSRKVLLPVSIAPPDPTPLNNHPPVGESDFYEAIAGTPLVVPAAGVLANDRDPDLHPLTAVLVDAPKRGSLELRADGSFTYRPMLYWPEVETFTYRPADPWGLGAPVRVDVQVRRAVPKSTRGAAVLAYAAVQSSPDSEPRTIALRASVSRDGRVQGVFTYRSRWMATFASTEIQALTVDDRHARVYGVGTSRGRRERFVVDLDDVADPGAGRDLLRIEVGAPYSVATEPIQSGEIRISPGRWRMDAGGWDARG